MAVSFDDASWKRYHTRVFSIMNLTGLHPSRPDKIGIDEQHIDVRPPR